MDRSLLLEKLSAIALRLLAYRPRSEKEVFSRLQRRLQRLSPQADETLIRRVIRQLKEQNLLNDEDFVVWWIDQRAQFRPRGFALLKAELAQKGIDPRLTQRILQHHFGGRSFEKKLAYRLLKKKFPSAFPPPAQLSSFLRRYGFSSATVQLLIDELNLRE